MWLFRFIFFLSNHLDLHVVVEVLICVVISTIWIHIVVVQAITLLDACVNNCGRYFLLEVYSSIQQVSYFDKMLTQIASREFETEFRKLLGKSHPKVAEKLKAMLKR